ncbi:flavin reductase family protein [Sporosarcina limicola]|uniref:Flavin reductase (DIM6/NTAB) family NADH-FMN oxidoreductase RutF n=1 Tax=Sporosarcina limicola TaxID=34101 RepID=A0A927MIA5_9BACL|nr:flavin reductase family protein [Sporosarcina limicola]MBE1554316.1 flavin reductase (DIM6/NTAB) family NADH-FMN oxidoreductase RutF [Sporosarcina limicola]
MDIREYRNCMGRFATGVTVVTCKTDDGYHGFTANSFTSVSLDPPLVLVSVDRKTKAFEHLSNNSFTINILNEKQEDTAMHFAGRPKEKEPFTWVEGEHTVRLEESLAHIECVPWAEYDGGDHVLFVGEVKNFDYTNGNALTYFSGKFSTLSLGE